VIAPSAEPSGQAKIARHRRHRKKVKPPRRRRAAEPQPKQDPQHGEKTDAEIGPISRRPACGSDDHPSKPKPGLPGTPTDAARTPQQRSFDFAQDFGCGLPLGLRLADTRKTAQHRSLDYARDFGSRLGRSPQQAKTGLAGDPDGRRENASAQGPSTSLRISPPGSDVRKTAQLYKKGGSMRNSARRLDYTGVMCLRITLRIAFQSASFR